MNFLQSFLFATLFTASIFIMSSITHAQSVGDIGVVNTSDGELNVRSGPGTGFKIMNVLRNGDKVTLLEARKTWARVSVQSKAPGWVYLPLLAFQDKRNEVAFGVGDGAYICNIDSKTTNVRAGPSAKDYAVVAELKNGHRVVIKEIKKNKGGFYYYAIVFQYEGEVKKGAGYVYHNALKNPCRLEGVSTRKIPKVTSKKVVKPKTKSRSNAWAVENKTAFVKFDGYSKSTAFYRTEAATSISAGYIPVGTKVKILKAGGNNNVKVRFDNGETGWLNVVSLTPRLETLGVWHVVGQSGSDTIPVWSFQKTDRKSMATIKVGSNITVFGIDNSIWALVKTSGNKLGWVYARFLEKGARLKPTSTISKAPTPDQADKNNLRMMIAGPITGEVIIGLDAKNAPNHVGRIMQLAQKGAYDGVVFHSVVDGYSVQAGDIKYGKMTKLDRANVGRGGSSLPNLVAEISKHSFKKGDIVMARGQDVDSANAQFFILLADAPFLDGKYTFVGRVLSGLNILKTIPAFGYGSLPKKPVYIKNMRSVTVKPIKKVSPKVAKAIAEMTKIGEDLEKLNKEMANDLRAKKLSIIQNTLGANSIKPSTYNKQLSDLFDVCKNGKNYDYAHGSACMDYALIMIGEYGSKQSLDIQFDVARGFLLSCRIRGKTNLSCAANDEISAHLDAQFAKDKTPKVYAKSWLFDFLSPMPCSDKKKVTCKLLDYISSNEKTQPLRDFLKATTKVQDAIDRDTGSVKFSNRGDDRLFYLDRLPPKISEIKNLTVLTAKSSPLKNLSPLEMLSSIEYLNIKDAKINDISALKNHLKMKSLVLAGTQIEDLSALSDMAELEYLDISDTNVTDLSALTNLTKITGLAIAGTKISDISTLSKMTNLEKLYMKDTDVSDLSPLRALKNLSVISLKNTRVTTLEPVSHFKNLQIWPEDFKASGKTNSEICETEPKYKACIDAAYDVGYQNEPDVVKFKKYTSLACEYNKNQGCYYLATELRFGGILEEDTNEAFSMFTSICEEFGLKGNQSACLYSADMALEFKGSTFEQQMASVKWITLLDKPIETPKTYNEYKDAEFGIEKMMYRVCVYEKLRKQLNSNIIEESCARVK